MAKCKFPACKFEGSEALRGVSLRADGLCLFHAAIEYKEISEEVFWNRFYLLLKEGHRDFSGVVFPGKIDFKEKNLDISSVYSFYNAIFHGETKFDNIIFQESVDFSLAAFLGPSTSFVNTEFGHGVHFNHTQFKNGNVYFNYTKFLDREIKFGRTEFAHDVIFRQNTISNSIDFLELNIHPNARFYFMEPIFLIESVPVMIRFIRVKFNPFSAHFEKVKYGIKDNYTNLAKYPVIIFRFCNLKEVFFAGNEMSIFSFFENAYFEEAFLSSNKWIKKNNRNNIAFEEIFFGQLMNSTDEDKNNDPYGVRDLNNYGQIAELYLRYKCAADKAKDYHLASGFYYNEFEMKRKFLIEKIKTNESRWLQALRFITSGRLWLYNLYKVFAGYGEKPGLSFMWLVFAIIAYSIWYMFQGIKTPNWTALYEFQWNLSLNLESLNHFIHAVIYTIARIVPKSYRLFESSDISIINDNPFIAISNWFVITILIVFIGVGLKRHFRRF